MKFEFPKVSLESALASVGPGWAPLVTGVYEYIQAINPLISVTQVKEKWGGLRIYTDNMDNRIDAAIIDAERSSLAICEECGHPGTLYKTSGGRYMTRCAMHGEELIFCGNPL